MKNNPTLATFDKICYTYDNLSRITKRTVYNECDEVVSEENFTYDAAGNITDAPNSCFIYDTNNRLITFNGNTVSYDMDGNMLYDGYTKYEYDSANRLVKAGDHAYTYNAEDIRIRNLCSDADTTYTYNTNCKLSQLLCKTTNGITTKYVYGLGLIGEEKECCFKTYHFDYRGSTVAITDECGNITDTFKYDTYGNVTEHIGDSFVIFGYNGRDGVITDRNGLYYMRARYYSPDLRRFVNADILRGGITDSTSLNRYAYVNGNPISLVDPTGYFGIITLMLIGAGIGAVCSAVGSVVSQKVESEINDEEFKLDVGQFISDTLWGAVDGAISFSPLGPTGMFVAKGLSSVGSSMTDELIDDEKGVNVMRVADSVFFDLTLDRVGPDFTNNVNISKALKTTNETIEDLARRKSRKWAEKQISQIKSEFRDMLDVKMFDEVVNNSVGITADAVHQRVKNALYGDTSVINSFGDRIVTSRK